MKPIYEVWINGIPSPELMDKIVKTLEKKFEGKYYVVVHADAGQEPKSKLTVPEIGFWFLVGKIFKII